MSGDRQVQLLNNLTAINLYVLKVLTVNNEHLFIIQKKCLGPVAYIWFWGLIFILRRNSIRQQDIWCHKYVTTQEIPIACIWLWTVKYVKTYKILVKKLVLKEISLRRLITKTLHTRKQRRLPLIVASRTSQFICCHISPWWFNVL